MKKCLCRVPPSPKVTNLLIHEYHSKWKPLGLTFRQFLVVSGYTNPAHSREGLDDHLVGNFTEGERHAELISIPERPVTGNLHVMVLLVDFSDRPGAVTREHYENLLFSEGRYPTGSMTDYYLEVSRNQVKITGEVHGWLRMPENYTYYTNAHSGIDRADAYPRDARRLAEDAITEALDAGIVFNRELDKLETGTITALFIVHSGRGAEKLHPLIRRDHIWSHKWNMKHPKMVSGDLVAMTYLMVPQEAALGVCVHELGHLAFQWQDFYDPNYDEDGDEWDGNGIWDVMASGSYAGNEVRPVHPAGLHKSQHGWIPVEKINKTTANVTLPPVTNENGYVIKIYSDHLRPKQYLLLENRAKQYFDLDLPGEGLLIWRVDEEMEMEGTVRPGMLLIQADGRHNLLDPDDYNNGDPGDPFPGERNVLGLSDQGDISTSFPGQVRSGISLKNIRYDAETKDIILDIEIVAAQAAADAL